MNTGIKTAQYSIIMRLDAHCVYDRDYIPLCLKCLQYTTADNTGGQCISRPGSDTLIAKAIACATASPFSSGNAAYRSGGRTHPCAYRNYHRTIAVHRHAGTNEASRI